MNWRPISFCPELIPALLNTKLNTCPAEPIEPALPCKGVTRRVVKKAQFCAYDTPADAVCPCADGTWIAWWGGGGGQAYWQAETERCYPNGGGFPCPYGVPGDGLWVREGCAIHPHLPSPVYYRADGPVRFIKRWRTSRFMPRWAARLFFVLKEVRVERVQDITEDEAEAEGCMYIGETLTEPTPREKFQSLWDRLNGKRGHPWDSNPWVFRLGLMRVEGIG